MESIVSGKRTTRGKRINELIGEAAEQDEQFYKNEIWEEDSDEGSYIEEEEKPDEFDSDFDETEDEGSENEDDEKAVARAEKSEKRKKSKGKYHEQGNKKKKVHTSEHPTQVPDSHRKSTDEFAIKSKQLANYLRKKLAKTRHHIKPTHSQFDLLKDALDTEITNIKWLENRKLAELERVTTGEKQKSDKSLNGRSYIRYHSKRGQLTTITFSDENAIPNVLKPSTNPSSQLSLSPSSPMPPSTPKNNTFCVITGQPARYRDPVTLLPYSNIEALREIKRRYHRKP